jgi:hypothetical protein
MSIMTVTTRITSKYLMGKTKWELAEWIMRDLDEIERLERQDLVGYLTRQWEWSKRTFGPGKRTKGILRHIEKELLEIEAKPDDLTEWADVVILAMDGFWRHGGKPEDLMRVLQAKQEKNFARVWPTPTSEDEATEHVRD